MSRKPRILFVLAEQLGWATYARLLRGFLSERDDVAWEVLNPVPRRIYRSLNKHPYLTGVGRLIRQVDPISAYGSFVGRPVRAAVDRFKPDLVHFADHHPAGSLTTYPGAPPFSVALDSTRPVVDRMHKRRAWNDSNYDREARLLRGAALLFPMSAWAGNSLTGDYGIPEARQVIMGPAVDPASIGSRSPDARSTGLPKVAFVGNHFRRKGGHLLVDWMKGPLAGRCELHIISSDPTVAGLAGPGIVVHGRVPHPVLMHELLPQMDILCHPTQSDMSAYVVVEAAFAGIPSVASRIGGVPELIVEGQTGWSLDPSDEDGFVKRLLDLTGDRTLISETGERAREHARKNYDANVNYGRLVDRLKGLAREVS
jgi:glycosyltransferase involved in cell wall biosynthesis